MSRLWAAVVGALGFVVVLPLAVLAGSSLGVPTMHWSGVTLAGAEVLSFWHVVEQGRSDELDATRLAQLESVQHAAIDRPHAGLVATYTAFTREQVVVETAALSHGLFADLGDRFGADVTVVYVPLAPVTYLAADQPGDGACTPTPPSWWERHEPLATWWLLVTGFPAYLGVAVLIELGVLLVWRRRARRSDAGATTPRPA